MNVGVIGASGFIGAAVTEHLLGQSGIEVVPFIHGTGNAARIARLGVTMTPLELCDRAGVARAVRECTHVVNCARTESPESRSALRHLVDACRDHGQRFIHLGSVTVYDASASDRRLENAPTSPVHGSHGWIKLQQDRLIRAAASRGLSSVVLCLPNVAGAQSPWLTALVRAILRGEFALLEDGQSRCDLVNIRNVVHAVTLALTQGPADGQRVFVTDDDPGPWTRLVEALTPLTGDATVHTVSRDALRQRLEASAPPSISLIRSLRHLASGEMRETLRRDPLWARTEGALRALARRLGIRPQGHAGRSPAGPADPLNVALVAEQLRDVTHSVERAAAVLGYRPRYRFAQSLTAFCRWYGAVHAWDVPLAHRLKTL